MAEWSVRESHDTLAKFAKWMVIHPTRGGVARCIFEDDARFIAAACNAAEQGGYLLVNADLPSEAGKAVLRDLTHEERTQLARDRVIADLHDLYVPETS